MKFEKWTYNKPLSMTGFGGGAGSLSRAGGGIAHPFDNMSAFNGATRIGTSDIIYYSSGGTFLFQDPNGGLSRFRFTVVGGGGSSNGDGGGWYGVQGGGGGGGARGEIQTGLQLEIGVGYGGQSPGQWNSSVGSGNDSTYVSGSINNQIGSPPNQYNNLGGGGTSFVKVYSNGHSLLMGYGGMPGLYGYHPTSHGDLSSNTTNSAGYAAGGGNGFWLNGGAADYSQGGGVTIVNPSTEQGGYGGCAAHQSFATPAHPYDFYYTRGQAGSTWMAGAGQSTTYSGPGGGGGSDVSNTYEDINGNATYVAGNAGSTASGLNTLLSGANIASAGGSGSNHIYQGRQSTRGTAGGGGGGNAKWDPNSDSWQDSFNEGHGIVIVEFLGF